MKQLLPLEHIRGLDVFYIRAEPVRDWLSNRHTNRKRTDTLKQLRIIIAISLLLALGGSATAISPFAPRGSGDVGAKLGIMSRTNIDIDGEVLEADANYAISLFWIVPVNRFIYSGLVVDFDNVEVLDISQFFLNVYVPIIYRQRFKPRGVFLDFACGPGLGHLAEVDYLRRSTYLTINPYLQIHFPQPKGRTWLLEVGASRSVAGGNSDHDVTWGPSYFFRVGYAL